MRNKIDLRTVTVDLAFWSSLAARLPAAVSVSVSSEPGPLGAAPAIVPREELAYIKSASTRPQKRARLELPLMREASGSDDVKLSGVTASRRVDDHKPAARFDIRSFDRQLKQKGHSTEERRELRELASRFPDLFRDGIGVIPTKVNSRAVNDLIWLMDEHSDNPNVRGFVEACFGQMIKRTESGSRALPKRDKFIREMVTAAAPNQSVLAMLKDPRFHEIIFPDRSYRHDDLAKLTLMRDWVSGHSKAQYDFLVSNANVLELRDVKAERLQYVMAVVAKRIDRSEMYDFAGLLSKKSFTLALELLHSTVADAKRYDLSVRIAREVMEAADRKVKTLVGARLLVFLAEHPDLIDLMERVVSNPENPWAAPGIAKLVENGRAHLDVYRKVACSTGSSVADVLTFHPVIVSCFNPEQCASIALLITQHNGGQISNFYPDGPLDVVNLTCEVIRRQHQLSQGPRTANSVAARNYMSSASNINRSLYSALVREGTLDTLCEEVTESLIQLHRDFDRPLTDHLESALKVMNHKAQILNATLPSGEHSTCDVLASVSRSYGFVKGLPLAIVLQFLGMDEHSRFMITQVRGSTWTELVNRYLPDFHNISHETLRELTQVGRYCSHPIPEFHPLGEAGLLIVQKSWTWFLAADDHERQRFLQRLHNQVEEDVGRVRASNGSRQPQEKCEVDQLGIHSCEVAEMVASTVVSLVSAYKITGWHVRTSVDHKGELVLEPIPVEVLEPEIENFRARLEADLEEKATLILQDQSGEKGALSAHLSMSCVEASNIHKNLYDNKVVPLARQITALREELEVFAAAQRRGESSPPAGMVNKIHRQLADRGQRLKTLTALTLPYGALRYLDSHHLESPPKNIIGTNFPKLSLKQILGMVLLMPSLDAEQLKHYRDVEWYEGLTTFAERQEGVYERLREALYDSHAAYLGMGELYDRNDSCWDGGVNRMMVAVRTLMDLNVMPAPGDFSLSFHHLLIETFSLVSAPAFLNDTAEASRTLRQQLIQQLSADLDQHHQNGDGSPMCVSGPLYKLVAPRVYAEVKNLYPKMWANHTNYERTKVMIKDVAESVRYVEVPQSFIDAYSQKIPARV